MAKRTVDELDVKNKKVLVRCDFNVPLDKQTGVITDDTRIRSALPTIQYLLDHEAKVILMSHLGRPKGTPDPKYSLAAVAERLQELLPDNKVIFLDSDVVVDDKVKEAVSELKAGQVAVLQNTRYQAGETKNDPEFSRQLASLADLYVNDAFGTAHRAHASNVGVASLLPSAIGFLIDKEIDVMGGALEHPDHPFVAIMGGAKVSDKISVIDNILDKVDTILIGGGMAYTFIKAKGYEVGRSLLEEDKIDYAKKLMEEAEAKGVKIFLPVDTVVTDELEEGAVGTVVDSHKLPADKMGVDIGPKTVEKFSQLIQEARTVVWNGPMGVFEMPQFAKGTFGVAEAMANCQGTTIVGGGDSASAIEKAGMKDKITHVSTGGGASLQFLGGESLPGYECITDR